MKRWVCVCSGISFLAVSVSAAPPTSGGPGGLGATDGASILELWLRADRIEGLVDGDAVTTQWLDLSGKGNHCRPDPGDPGGKPSQAGNPQYYSSATDKGGAAVFFDKDALYTLSETMNLTRAHTYMLALRDVDNSSGYWMWFQHEGVNPAAPSDDLSGPAVGHWNVDEWVARDWMSPGGWMNRDNSANTNRWQVYTVTRPADTTPIGMYRGGFAETTASTNTWQGTFGGTTNRGQMLLGMHVRGAGGPQFGKFYLSEAMVFTTNLNSAERIVVENYLNARHMTNAMASNDRYDGDTPARGNYDRDVFGIGRVDANNELTANGSAGLGFEAAGGALGNDEWLLAGHRMPANKRVNTDLPAGVSQRWARVWYLDKTGAMDIDMAFDFSDGGLASPGGGFVYELLYSADSSLSFVKLGIGATVSGDTVTFSVPDASLADGYYTLGSTEPYVAAGGAIAVKTDGGPGGIGGRDGTTPLKVWLRADRMEGVAEGQGITDQWRDDSGSGNHSAPHPGHPGGKASGAGYPTYVSGATFKGGPAVRFHTANMFTTPDNLFLPAHCTFFITARPLTNHAGTGHTGPIVTFQHQGPDAADVWDDLAAFEILAYNYGSQFALRNWNGGTPAVGVMPSNTWHTYAVAADSSSAIGYLDNAGIGLSIANNWTGTFGGATNMGHLMFAKHYRGHAQYMNGYIAEVAVFATNLNAAERTIVNNYLHARHFTNDLPSLDRYAGKTPGNGQYDQGVFGLGSLGAAHAVSNNGLEGFGMASMYDSLDINEWVLAGHRAPYNYTTGDDVPAGLSQRWARVWYIDKTGELDVKMAFNFGDAGLPPPAAGADYELLYSPSNAYAFAVLGLPADVDGDTVSFEVLDNLLLNGYYTLGSTEAPATESYTVITGGGGPGGIGTTDGTSALQLWLRADAVTGVSHGANISSQWRDLSGYGNHCQSDPGHSGGSQGGDPTYVTNATPSGRPAIRFDAADGLGNDLFTPTTNAYLPPQSTIFVCGVNYTNPAYSSSQFITFQHPGASLSTKSDDLSGPSLAHWSYGKEVVLRWWPGQSASKSITPDTWSLYTVHARTSYIDVYGGSCRTPRVARLRRSPRGVL